MPRTKITKSKRNRDAAKEEKEDLKMERLKDFDSSLEQMEQKIISSHSELIEEIIFKTQNIKLKLPKKILSMINFFCVDENTINDLLKSDSVNSSKYTNASALGGAISSTMSCSSKKSNDEEDNVSTRGSNLLPLPSFPASLGRTPGPLSSAKAKARIRRSRSASGQILSAQKSKPISRTTSEHSSRSKMRTPLLQQKPSRPKAISADRAAVLATPNSKYSNSPVMLRWAKPHETIISLSGSPLVTPMMASSMANINIPTINGMVSLRPKNIDPNELGQRIAESLCPESLAQIKQLQSHLNVIMSMAEKN